MCYVSDARVPFQEQPVDSVDCKAQIPEDSFIKPEDPFTKGQTDTDQRTFGICRQLKEYYVIFFGRLKNICISFLFENFILDYFYSYFILFWNITLEYHFTYSYFSFLPNTSANVRTHETVGIRQCYKGKEMLQCISL